jgi:Mrp family chromosome partitioning ATPase
MGRILDALKRADSTRGEVGRQPSAAPTVVPIPRVEEVVAEEEIPFIEVGPHKSMEASPSVLASLSPSAPQRVPLGNVPAAAPALRSVQFRPLSVRGESRSSFAPELAAYHAPEQSAARQYREVLEAVMHSSGASERATALLFTSVLPRTGNTTTLLNVAITAARQGHHVVVVDANLRQPAVAEKLGLLAAPGLREVLTGAASLEEAVRSTAQANLFALTSGVRDSGSGMRFVGETMRSLLRQLRQRFPLVFVDGPSWDGRHDIKHLGAACDMVYLVVPEQEAETPQTDALLQLIPSQGARLAGCILVAGPSFLS